MFSFDLFLCVLCAHISILFYCIHCRSHISSSTICRHWHWTMAAKHSIHRTQKAKRTTKLNPSCDGPCVCAMHVIVLFEIHWKCIDNCLLVSRLQYHKQTDIYLYKWQTKSSIYALASSQNYVCVCFLCTSAKPYLIMYMCVMVAQSCNYTCRKSGAREWEIDVSV